MSDRNRYSRYGRGNNFSGSGSSFVQDIDPEALQNEIESKFESYKNGDGLAQVLSVKADENGKARWLFMTMPADVASLLQFGLNNALPWLNERGAGFIYEKTKAIWERNLERPSSSHSAGLNAAKIFSAVLIGAEPVDRLLNIRRESAKKRKQLIKELAPVIAASGKDYKNNEVVKVAFDRIHSESMNGLKSFAAQIPALAGITAYAAMDYGELKKDKQQKLDPVHSSKTASVQDMHKLLEEHKDSDNKWRMFVMPVLAGAGALIDSRISKDSEKGNNIIAADLIFDLAKEVDASSPSAVSMQSVLEIFQQNERDHGRPLIGNKLMAGFEPALRQITKAIASGELDPMALFNLVGDGKVIIHYKSGKRGFANAKQVEELIKAQQRSYSPHDLTSAEEFLADLSNPEKMLSLIKQNLGSMNGNDKALFAALFPDEVLGRAGMSKSEISEAHKQAHDLMYGFVAAIIADLANKNPEYLKNIAHCSDENIEFLRNFAQQIESEGIAPVKQIVDGKDKSVIDLIRTAVLYEQMETGKNPWTEKIKSSKSVGEILSSKRGEEVVSDSSAVGRESMRRKNRSDDPSNDLQRV